jgi:hypothetical protein
MSNTDQSGGVKIVVAYIIFVITSYGMIDGLVHPDDMAFVRNAGSGADLQPESFILQVCCWIITLSINVLSGIYLFAKLKSIV